MERLSDQITRRRFLRLAGGSLAAAGLAPVLAACGGGGSSGAGTTAAATGAPAASNAATSGASSSEPISLTMWWWGEQEAKGAKNFLAESVQAYEQQHPNVSIKTVLQTTDGLVPAFKAAAAAKKGPDIQYFWGGIWSLEDAWAGATKPVSDYIPKDELSHYLNASEDTYDGKVWTAPWYVQPSFPVLYRKDVLDKAGIDPPQTWDDFLAAADKLNGMGITPMAGGMKDGWFGGWLYSLLAGQNLQSVGDLLAAVSGQKKFTDPEFADWWLRLQEMRDRKCWNDDINSLELYQGQQQWVEGKAAMTITAGSDAKKFIEQVGADKVGVMTMPKWADGPYAGKLGSTSQTLGITAWTQYPQVCADFIRFLHTPGRMKAWFETTGAFPADDRFDSSLITLAQQKTLFELLKDGAPYLENFIPTELDSKANFEQSQLVLAGTSDAQKAADATEQVADRIRRTNPDLIENFQKWAETYS